MNTTLDQVSGALKDQELSVTSAVNEVALQSLIVEARRQTKEIIQLVLMLTLIFGLAIVEGLALVEFITDISGLANGVVREPVDGIWFESRNGY